MTAETIGQLLRRQAAERGDAAALRYKTGPDWKSLSWQDWWAQSERLAAYLIHRGIQAGDRVAVISDTCHQWVLADLAIMIAGGVTVSVYPTLSDEQTQFILADSGTKLAFCQPAMKNRAGLKALSQDAIICFDDPAFDQLSHPAADLMSERNEARRRLDALTDTDTASLVYSSGTTGNPRGVVISHGNIRFEVDSILEALSVGPDDEQLLFLPLAHIFGRMLQMLAIRSGMVTSFAESTFKALDNMSEINPTLFASVPRLFEKIYAVSQQASQYDGALKERLYRWATEVGREASTVSRRGRRVQGGLSLRHRYADKLVLSKIRERFGSRLRFAVSGGAPLSAELGQWFHAAGVLVLEVYGLTECTGGATINRPECFAFGSVGGPLPGVEVQIATDGEILLRGPNLSPGYWSPSGREEQLVDDDGWLHTGDLGQLRTAPGQGPEPMLYVSGRKKEIIVTAGGKNVAPRPLEQRLEHSPWILQAVVAGDGRPYLSVLLTLDLDRLLPWARERDLELGENPADHPEVHGLIDTELALLNQNLPRFEQIRRHAVLPRPLSTEEGELTDTLKLKRQLVLERYREQIAELYDGPPPSSAGPS